jgi:hypothetical protein
MRRPAVLAAAPFVLGASLTVVLLWGATYERPADAEPAPGDLGAIRHLLHHGLGMAPARAARPLVHIDDRDAEPGDILLASRSGGGYGHFTHATAFIDRHRVLHHNVLFGIFRLPATQLVSYDHVRLLRPRLPRAARLRAAAFLSTLRGATFNLFATKHDPNLWHCAKSVWQAYAREGLDLAPGRTMIVPDDLAHGPRLETLREWGSP